MQKYVEQRTKEARDLVRVSATHDYNGAVGTPDMLLVRITPRTAHVRTEYRSALRSWDSSSERQRGNVDGHVVSRFDRQLRRDRVSRLRRAQLYASRHTQPRQAENVAQFGTARALKS